MNIFLLFPDSSPERLAELIPIPLPISQKNKESKSLMMVSLLSALIATKDLQTYMHCFNVAVMAQILARQLSLSTHEIQLLKCAAVLHDIGKLYLPPSILLKTGPLTREEYDIIKTHVKLSTQAISLFWQILNNNNNGKNGTSENKNKIQKKYDSEEEDLFYKTIADSIACHHESYDGSGYPCGLSGENINLSGKILKIIDCIEAMLTFRPYRLHKPVYSPKETQNELEKKANEFDPSILPIAINLLTVFQKIIERNKNLMQGTHLG